MNKCNKVAGVARWGTLCTVGLYKKCKRSFGGTRNQNSSNLFAMINHLIRCDIYMNEICGQPTRKIRNDTFISALIRMLPIA